MGEERFEQWLKSLPPEPGTPLLDYLNDLQQCSDTANSSAALGASPTRSPNIIPKASKPRTTATSTNRRAASLSPEGAPFTRNSSPKSPFTKISAPTTPNKKNSISSPAASPALERPRQAAKPDSITPNHNYGAKDCVSSAKSDPNISSGNNLWALPLEVYEQFLGDAEWLAIKQRVLQSPLVNSAHPTDGKEHLLLPTLTTGSGTKRNAGQTKLEQRLKQLSIIPPGYQFSPEAMAMYMGFPWNLFSSITGQRFTQLPTSFPAASKDVTMSADLPGKLSPQPKRRSPSTSLTGTTNKRRGRPRGSSGKASGCLVPFTEARRGKTYPIIQGERVSKDIALDYPHHYRWFYQWREWQENQQRWLTRSKRIKFHQVTAVHQLIQANQNVVRILNFIETGRLE